jgi:hypothetical protein
MEQYTRQYVGNVQVVYNSIRIIYGVICGATYTF